ncbi:MAG: ATP-binding protein [Staphylothermus sp.]|nr:ATP-binding protein [Staphylothermus sp.]
MKIRIKNFKTIRDAEFELAPLTILMGPPASGKSNVLDALAFIGYFYRLLQLGSEYDNNTGNLEPLKAIVRSHNLEQLFRYQDLSLTISIAVEDKNTLMELKVFYEKGSPRFYVNDTDILFDFDRYIHQGISNIINRLNIASKLEDKMLIEGRIYGYDRYGLSLSSCHNLLHCGFHLRLKNNIVRNTPKTILSELGWNAPHIIKDSREIIVNLNYTITEKLDEKVEVKVSRSGSVVIFDYDVEVDVTSVSDTIFRILYYLLALRSGINYVKKYGLEKKFIFLLEGPVAHVFPFFTDLLADYISKAAQNTYVVVTTHNPILVSTLWDRVKDVKTYYVMRDKQGSTNVAEIDIAKLAEELITSEDLLFMSPREVLEKYAVKNP